MDKTKVMLIAEAMGGGVRRHIIDLIENIDPSRFETVLLYGVNRADDIFLSKKKDLEKKAKLIGNVHLYREISLSEDLKAYREIKKEISAFRPDVVHCHSSKAGILGRMAAKRLGVEKIYYTPHAYSFQAPEFSGMKRQVFTRLERFFSRNCTTKTFNVSFGEMECALKEKIDNEKKFKVIYNGIPELDLPDKAVLRRQLSLPQDAFVAGVTARLNEQKDPVTFAKIAEKVIKYCDSAHFVYAGDGPLYDRVSSYIKERDLEKNIHLLGYRRDAEQLTGAFDVYLLTSLYEGLPYSPIEAMRADIPIVATRATGNTELVEDGVNGKLFDIGNADQAAEILLDFIEGRIDLRGKARHTYETRFTIDKMVKNIEDMYLA